MAFITLRVLSVFRSRDILESGKKKCNRPKLRRSFRHTSLAKAFIAPGYWTGSSSTTYSMTYSFQSHVKNTANYLLIVIQHQWSKAGRQ